MRRVFIAAITVMALGLAGCGDPKFKRYDGPEVTRIVVLKENRRMYLYNGDRVLRGFDIALGFEPIGHKTESGDGKTPVGDYIIDRRNPNSAFHLSIGINYPDADDIARARALGVDPGGNIFIHGQSNRFRGLRRDSDWTWGCIAVTNAEMEDIYAMVNDGTPITIYD